MKPFYLLLIIPFLIGAAFGQSDWSVVQGPQQPNIYSRNHAYFLNENEGWIYGTISSVSVILHTADAGATWTDQESPPSEVFNTVPENPTVYTTLSFAA
ncbi:MAG: hypothetical protein P8184_14415 [Calditrichia bacterium]